MKQYFRLVRLLTLLACGICAAAMAAEPKYLLKDFDTTRVLTIGQDGPCVLFDVWVAVSPAERSRGLMFVEQLDAHEGMVFFYRQPAQIAMWMKNTLISLDMLFIRGDLTIATISTDAVPMSTDSIYSGEAVQVVLELPAGSVRRWNIQPEDRLWFVDRQPDGPVLEL